MGRKKESGSINIDIDDQYRLTSDKMNIVLEEKYVAKKGVKANQECWKALSFHGTIDGALIKYLKTRTNTSDANTAAQLITEWNKTMRSLRKIMKEYKRSNEEDK